MRGIFLDQLHAQMKLDENIFFLTADMGINLVEKFEVSYPDRFLNVGIAEQNLIGIASGLAESGMKPYVYTISNFLIHRCFEQIRNDVVLHDLPVVLIGTSTGYDNGALGPTHHMLEDWGVVSNLPNIRIYAPFNKESALRIFENIVKNPGPTYVRIAKGDGVPDFDIRNNFMSAKEVVLSYGSASIFAQKYASDKGLHLVLIEELGRSCYQFLENYPNELKEITVVEDHFPQTGMYSYVCQWINEKRLMTKVSSIAPSNYQAEVGLEISDYL